LIFPLYEATVRPVHDVEGNIVSYNYLYYTITEVKINECALTRAYSKALEDGKLSQCLAQVQFMNESGTPITTTNLASIAYNKFFELSGMSVFGASQHMCEVGKVLIFNKQMGDIKNVLMGLFGEEFANRLDLHKYLKLLQIMCQPGRLLGSDTIEPVKHYDARVYIDSKHPEDDGIIFVNPTFWDKTILSAYTTEKHSLGAHTSLIKVNSSDGLMTIKGVMKRATSSEWFNLTNRIGKKDMDIVLCGNAIKDNVGFLETEIYDMDESRFA
jgi:hypothetical protein